MTDNSVKTARLAQVLAERANRSADALKLFRPLPTQVPFFKATASEISLRGGNRAGKSLSLAVATAMIALKASIKSFDGTMIPPLYQADRPLTLWIVGYDGRHIGDTIYRLLFRSGLFRIIRDQHTQEWRSFQPWNPEDMAREKEAKPAPPLIPARFIDEKGWSWENKAGRIFDVCRLLDGTEIRAWSSKAEPKQGDPVDWIWIDEDMYRYGHYQEYRMRTSDTKGKIGWAYFPRGRNWAARELSNRAKEQRSRANPDAQEIVLTYSANPFIDEDEKRKKLEGMSANERRARDQGEFVTDHAQMYPNFSEYVHATPKLVESDDVKIDAFLRKTGGEPDDDWTRYMVLDPGHSLAAVLFAAVPPAGFGDHVVLYDELYLERHDADQLAAKVRDKIGSRQFEAFIIDDHAGRMTPMGYGKGQTVKQHYVDAFRKYNVRSLATGFSFIPGADNVAAGIQAVRTWLSIRNDGTTKLKYVINRVPNLKNEMEMYSKFITSDNEVQDEPAPRQRDHACDCLRYLAAYNPQYKKPPPPRLANHNVDAMKTWINQLFKKPDNRSVLIGPAGRAGAA